ncbi:MAG: DSD1 family PLP-dependent enzyme [Burkholderiaceae bacterium]|nr:DSD1 family PLP-dependent enzyme [Burkholderiaceae bacterium]
MTDRTNWHDAPASVGDAISAIDTPALVIDLDAFEHNLRTVHSRVKDAKVALRAHGKAHKCPDIARIQVAAGAQGVCCQKASEAQVFVEAGITDVLITNEIVGVSKAERVARLARQARIGLCVDAPFHVAQIAHAARTAGSTVEIYIEIDVGQSRCGVHTIDQALELARLIAAEAPSLRFMGLHAYHGASQHIRDPAERSATVLASVDTVRTYIDALAAAGYACAVVTGGGTGTYDLVAASAVYTEVQPGSYVLMDRDYALNHLAPGEAELRQALYGLCTVISVSPTHAVLDGGLKTFAVDSGLPRMVLDGWTVKSISDEHTVITPSGDAPDLQVGDKVRLVPGHCDPTVNLHDWLIALRGQIVENVWPVSARGALF